MDLKDIMPVNLGLTEAKRAIRLRLSQSDGVLEDRLLIKHVSGTESINGGLEYRLLCVSSRGDLPLKDFIAIPVEIQFVTDRGALRSVCGLISQASAGHHDGGLASYQLIMRDALALMEQRVNTRVFRNLNELDISKVILDEWKQNNPILARAFDIDWNCLSGTYPAREFTMQHNESDSAFLRRLWKRQGIAWFIRPGKSGEPGSSDFPSHTLVLADNTEAYQQNGAGMVRYHQDSSTEQRDTVTSWNAVRSLRPGQVTRQSWDYANAGLMETASPTRMQQGSTGDQMAASLDDYVLDVPHIAENSEDYERLGELRMLRHELESKCFQGEGSVRDLCVGQWIGLDGHPDIDSHAPHEREFVITSLEVDADNNLPKDMADHAQRLFSYESGQSQGFANALGKASSERGARYTNRFSCVRRGIPIIPAFDPAADLPRPQIQSAIVVGPEGEEVHCDEQGRVKINFPGARPSDHTHAQGAGASKSERDSAWVRVASTWASNQWGSFTLPRVGDEVLVGFLGGDPDKPIIIGQVYNGKAPPPNFTHAGKLPENRYVSGIKSKEVRGRRYNQLRLDDTPEQISAQLASEHEHTQLNLGFLTHPRIDGEGEPRGEGAELRTDGALALRSAKLMLLSTQAMKQAQGTQLERQVMLTALESSHGLLEQLGKYAAEHHALPFEAESHDKINKSLEKAEQGSNTDPQGGVGGDPLIAMYGSGGFAFATPYSTVTYSGKHHDLVAQQNVQLTAGENFNVNAGKGISLFAHNKGVKLIAHRDDVAIQAHRDSIKLAAQKDVHVSASSGEITIAADKRIMLVCGGGYIKIEGGNIELGCPGTFTVKASQHAWSGPSSASREMQKFSEGALEFNDRFVLVNTLNEPVANLNYQITRADGSILRGVTNAQGQIEQQQSLLNEQIQIKILG
ncbi:type VI secretion system tip protein VgrG [Janthinobacterium sp. 17J80-10]|uniref:type VI secretion system Vgr family protein n=1 Tax=Janthinobacterium sp. 17J80-10 TaxID=2497863 RepID=UPI0010057E1C|nr:type VI secretion system tip protein VgrG [Janthinobacterium sp. 17J80-10]QAU34918.1 type VI secretion system tip protein VgrG [Janthinobacterium sp. 17J80-10]